ncbi:MAG: gliding motility-associated C-terminal domain-containing protein, partial [Bacteroidota bacterium]
MRIFSLLLCGMCWVLPQMVLGQADSVYWFAVPEVAEDHGDRPAQLRISAFSDPATITISLPANPAFVPITRTLAPDQTGTVNLTNFLDEIENAPHGQILNRGLLIESTSPIAAYYEIRHRNNPELFTLKGRNALGTDFFVPTQFAFNNEVGNNAFDIVATRDQTTITITPTANAVGHARNSAFTIVLNRGQTYSVAASSQGANQHLKGSKVTSDKPIAITNSDDSIRIGWGWDLTGDQLVPIDALGTEYIVVQGEFNAERVFVVATENGTSVEVAGGLGGTTTMGAGEARMINFTAQSMYIKSSAPIYVLHLTGVGNEAGSALIPPISCTGVAQVGFIRGAGQISMILLTEAGNQDDFVLNGDPNAISPGGFSAVPGTNSNWVAARINNANTILSATSTNLLQNTEGFFHLGILDNTQSGTAYGYFSQFNSLNFGGQEILCKGDTLILDGGPDMDAYLWDNGSRKRFRAVVDSGLYTVTVTRKTCTVTDTFEVDMISPGLNLGEDTTICEGDVMELAPLQALGTFLWSDGGTDLSLTVDAPGIYWVEHEQEGCYKRDSVEVFFKSKPPLDLGTDTLLCYFEAVDLDVTVPGATYRWQDGHTGSTYTIVEPGIYWVDLNLDGCQVRDSLINEYKFPDLDLGPDSLLCQGEKLVLTVDIPNAQYLWQDGSMQPSFWVPGPGQFHLEADDGCQVFRDTVNIEVSDCSCGVHVPTGFTPNGDGLNEYFGAVYQCAISNFDLRVYNRWGLEVFATQNPDGRWDGRVNGKYV